MTMSYDYCADSLNKQSGAWPSQIDNPMACPDRRNESAPLRQARWRSGGLSLPIRHCVPTLLRLSGAYWLNVQARFDLEVARERIAAAPKDRLRAARSM